MALQRHESRSPRTETTVILKRQLPIRFDETPRSWLGGLPKMPRFAFWPRNRKFKPLHFIAQICCADLPAQLWEGNGPRKGWLLVFVDANEIVFGEPVGNIVRVLHFNRLGAEKEPPRGMPTMRHVMTDQAGFDEPGIRPGVPKLWRKWPVDIVVHERALGSDGRPEETSQTPSPEELYGAPASKYSMAAIGTLKLDRPLTWRGALYLVEGLVNLLEPSRYREHFVGRIGLMDFPDLDASGTRAEFHRRVAAKGGFEDERKDTGGYVTYWGPKINAVRDAMLAEIKIERQTGWIARSVKSIGEEVAKCEARIADLQRELAEIGSAPDDDRLKRLNLNLTYETDRLDYLGEYLQHFRMLAEAYPGSEGEQALNADIPQRTEAHLAWTAEQRIVMQRWFKRILAQKLEEPLPDQEWEALVLALSARSTFWRGTHNRKVLEKVERTLLEDCNMHMAVREDMLDLYSRDEASRRRVPRELVDDMESRLRETSRGDLHRMGGKVRPDHAPPGSGDKGLVLAFSIASDDALGWTWCDVDQISIAIPQAALRRGAWRNAVGWVDAS